MTVLKYIVLRIIYCLSSLIFVLTYYKERLHNIILTKKVSKYLEIFLWDTSFLKKFNLRIVYKVYMGKLLKQENFTQHFFPLILHIKFFSIITQIQLRLTNLQAWFTQKLNYSEVANKTVFCLFYSISRSFRNSSPCLFSQIINSQTKTNDESLSLARSDLREILCTRWKGTSDISNGVNC